MQELEKKYNHLEIEKNKYNSWLEKELFKCGDTSKKPYAIVLPPPNVTGVLHLGHAWDVAIQDIIIRFKKMQGYDTLWLPGMDHAAIATEAKVVKRLKDNGINKYEYGRENFLKACWDWTNEHGDIIRSQWGKLGLSLDYSKERFTLDEGLSRAVQKVFIDYYNEGIIYRGEKIINWDPVAKTALSNEEVIYKEEKGAFYHLKYKLEDSEEYIEVATTRPETLFGDVAVAVNPEDKRYKKYVGKNVILPVLNKKIPVITDEHADMEKGTGAVKITPAHDPNDFEVGLRHNLDRIIVMNDDATMNDLAAHYKGLSREDARKKLLIDLENDGLLLKVEEITHEVGHSERTGVMVEPMLKKQWFVKMRELALNVLLNQKNNDTKVHFVPERFEKTMNHWMEITYDWCISRQLWWGHRIPAWYKDDLVFVGMSAPSDEWIQDDDVLDTWFSSALWPFATLGWPDDTHLLERYYPNNTLVTGYDIIPFWVNRMAFQGEKLLGKRPFEHCLIHGLIRDKEGRKMSKSLGNGVDPMEMCDKYGADSLRYYLTTTTSPGMDLSFDEDKLKSTWNFINKLWNASRFVLMNIDGIKELKLDNLNKEDEWILTKLNNVIKDVTKYMEKFEFNNVNGALYSFIWNDFCDNYIEMAKFNIDSESTKSTLLYVLTNILKMLHPFMPYVTDEIYNNLPIKEDNILLSEYPKEDINLIFKDSEKEVDEIIQFIKEFRNTLKENNIFGKYSVKLNFNEFLVNKILKLDDKLINDFLDKTSFTVRTNSYEGIIYYEKEITEEDIRLKEKEINELKISIEKRRKLLENEAFTSKAPESLVLSEKEKLELELKKLEKLQN